MVRFLKTDSRARYQGYKFFFIQGFCWSDISNTRIRCRLKGNGIYDVKSMSLFSLYRRTPDWFIVSIMVSSLIGNYIKTFINNTISFQINDARQLPIIVPNEEQLIDFKTIFDSAYEIKKNQFASKISSEMAESKLNNLQEQLDKAVNCLYGI